MTAQPSIPRAAYIAWISVCVVWGTTYLAIRVALETIPPALVGGLRFTVAGAVLALVLYGCVASRCRAAARGLASSCSGR